MDIRTVSQRALAFIYLVVSLVRIPSVLARPCLINIRVEQILYKVRTHPIPEIILHICLAIDKLSILTQRISAFVLSIMKIRAV